MSVVKEEKAVSPPRLYDLTTLQRDANRIFGFTAKETLEYFARQVIDMLKDKLPFPACVTGIDHIGEVFPAE